MPSCYKSPKVRHHRLPARQQDVLRFDVAVHHVVAVGVTKGARHLARDPQGLLERQLPLPLEPVPQRFPLDVRHDVKEELGRLPRIVQRQDVRVGQPGSDLDLAQEPLGAERCGDLGRSTLMATRRPCLRSRAR